MSALACAELTNAREQLRCARTGEVPETVSLAAVEGLLNAALEKRLAPLELHVRELEQQITAQVAKSASEKKDADDRIEFLSSRLKLAEATVARLQSQASEADARHYAELSRGFGDTNSWETSSNGSQRRAVSALFGGLRHYMQSLMRGGAAEPALPRWNQTSMYV
eukprot:TRINITY_DN59454_c0_g1_i1.p1 TRINITY_DN59454_c0_g1~~TRINITY_DN59454_c0_g1_i1.p1  ORF type:complete len:166 (+),score=41.41 TRINITY_DN59454_c0_g1_i1:49-546(+)